jgi:hypothetical protein
MTYHIYYHNDFDGRASAAVFLDFLEQRGDTVGSFTPVDFSLESKWPTMRFRRPAIVVDFFYHPRAAFWIDHHPTAFLKPLWQRRFKPAPVRKAHFSNGFHAWDPAYRSACHLAVDSLGRHFGYRPPRHIRELARWLDVVDMANFRLARQTIEKKEPALKLEELIDLHNRDARFADGFIRELATRPLASIIRDRGLKPLLRKAQAERKRLLRFYRQNLRVDGRVAFIDLAGLSSSRELRFAPFYLAPKVLYAVRLKKVGSGYFKVGAGVNPWRRKENKIHLGEFFRKKYGGGGHAGVGGAEIYGTARRAEQVAEETRAFLKRAAGPVRKAHFSNGVKR